MAKKIKQLIKSTLYNKKGFTLIELIAVIILLMIALALGAMSLFNWLHHSEFIKNEEYARQTYLTAQTALVNMKSDGGIENLVENIVAMQVDGRDRAVTTLVGAADKPNYEEAFNDITFKGSGGNSIPRIYALIGTTDDYKAYQNKYNGTHYKTADGTVPELSADAEMLYNLIDPYIYDKSMLYNTICVEIDVEEGAKYSKNTALTWAINDRVVLSSAHIHSVFFSTMAKDFTYDSAAASKDIHDVISLNAKRNPDESRDPDFRETLMLGYYSVDDRGNVADIATQKLKMKDARIVNDETLDLDFSSTASGEAEYNITLYSDGMDDPTKPVMTAKFTSDGLPVSNSFARLSGTLYRSDGTKLTDFTNWKFPYTYDGYEHKITLDAMMDADAYSASLDDAENFSISRLLSNNRTVSDSANSEIRTLLISDIHAEIQVSTTASSTESGKSSNTVETNSANPMFQSTAINLTGSLINSCEAGITKFRHLSNIRFLDNENEDLALGDSQVVFTLKNAIDWTNQTYPTVMYDTAGNKLDVLKSFPMIPEFQKNWIFATSDSALKDVSITNLYMDEKSKVTSASVFKNTAAEGDDYKNTLALFGVNKGTISGLLIKSGRTILNAENPNPLIAGANDSDKLNYLSTVDYSSFEPEASATDSSVRAAGIVCGINRGLIQNVKITSDENDTTLHRGSAVVATLAYNAEGTGVGQVCGINETPISTISTNSITKASTQGVVKANISGTTAGDVASARNAGIGGVAGYMSVSESDGSFIGNDSISQNTVKEKENSSIVNNADVTGNMYAGGVVGNINVSGASVNHSQKPTSSQIKNVINKGLVLCSVEDGRYIGGIAGYSNGAVIESSDSSPGYNNSTILSEEIRTKCLGDYVGGIVGYSNSGEIYDCSTVIDQSGNGYVLGRDNVGGIVGGTGAAGYIQGQKDDNNKIVEETENGCYVFGRNNVGGIIGDNTTGVSFCVNTGLVGGYGKNVGGIAGSNVNAEVKYCTTKIANDTDNSKYLMLKDTWKSDASNVGGIVGYNKNGTIIYDNTANNTIGNKMNAYVVAVGENNVGGIIGLNESGTVKLKLKNENETTTEEEDEAVTPSVMDSLSGVISGKVYGSGDCVGGIVGLNLSSQLFSQQNADGTYTDSGLDNLSSHMYWVEGKNAVGGIIGANLIATNQNVKMSMHADNANENASVKGRSLVGGLIGYNRILNTSLTGSDSRVNDLIYVTGSGTGVATGSLVVKRSDNTFMDVTSGATTSTTGRLIIEGLDSNDSYANKTKVSGSSYVSGIVGKNDETTNLVIKDCINKGEITGILPVAEEGESNVSTEIKIGALLSGLEPTEDIYDKTTILVGGIVGENTVNSVVDNCVNEGNVLVESDVEANGGIAGVAGINRGLIYRCQLGNNIGDVESGYTGGIVGINYNENTGDTAGSEYTYSYTEKDSTGTNVAKTLSYTIGTVENCNTEPYGDHTQLVISGKDCIGGIAAVNYKNANVTSCGMTAKISAANGNNIGGLVGVNYGNVTVGSTVDDYKQDTTVTIEGLDYVGGVVGLNKPVGNVIAVKDEDGNDVDATTKYVVINGNMYVGGIVGFNEGGFVNKEDGTVQAFEADETNATDENDAIPKFINNATVKATDGYAGGIIGMQQSANSTISNAYNYGSVTSSTLYAGGITAMNAGTVKDEDEYPVIENCANYGSVTASSGFAGAIAAVNRLGKISNCTVDTDVEKTGKTDLVIYSRVQSSTDADSYAGIITASNSGIISGCNIEKPASGDIVINTSAHFIGGITGCNTDEGIVRDDEVNYIKFDTSVMESTGNTERYTVGGIAGTNEGIIYKSKVNTDLRGNSKGSEDIVTPNLNTKGNGSTFTVSKNDVGFSTVKKLGGIAGINSGAVKECKYSGKMVVKKSEIDNAYGGIAGENVGYDNDELVYDEDGNIVDDSSLELVVSSDDSDKNVVELAKGSIEDCDVEKIQLSAPGLVNFSAGTSYDQKARMGAAVGGIVGNNGEGAFIRNSFIDRNIEGLNKNIDAVDSSKLTSYVIANEGLVGGVAGSNIGTIEDSGAVSYKMLTNGYTTEDGVDFAPTLVHSYDPEFSDDNTPNNDESDDFFKDDFVKLKAAAGHGSVLVSARRNTTFIGGITGYNGGSGTITGSVTGSDWHVYFYSASNDPGSGGVVGWAESADGFENIVNMATMVYKSGTFVGNTGGIIGRIWSNTRFVLSNCYNFGKICCVTGGGNGGRRAGGIMGGNKFEGGDILNCHNYGTVKAELLCAGILAGSYSMNNNSPMVIQSCTNHGKIYYTNTTEKEPGRTGVYTCSAGIAASMANSNGAGSSMRMNISSCTNYGDVVRVNDNEVEQPWTDADKNSSAGIFGRRNTGTVTISYCRNFGRSYWSIAGESKDSDGNVAKAGSVEFKKNVVISKDAGPIARESEADLVTKYPFGYSNGDVDGNIFIYADSDKTDVTINALADAGDLTSSGISSNFALKGSVFDNSPVLYASKYSGGDDYMYYAMYQHPDNDFDGITADGKNTADTKSSLISMINGSIGKGDGNTVPISSAVNGTVYGTIGTNTDYNLLFNIYGKDKDVDGYSEGNYTVGLNILNSTYSPEDLFASKTTAEKFARGYYQSLTNGGWDDSENTSSDGTSSGDSSSSKDVVVRVSGGGGGSSSTGNKLSKPYGGNAANTAISGNCSGGSANVWWNSASMDSNAFRYEVEYYAFDTQEEATSAINSGRVSNYYTVATSGTTDDRDKPFAVEYFYGSKTDMSSANPVKASVINLDVAGKWYVARVRACVGMYASTNDSDWAYTTAIQIKEALPRPEIRLQFFDTNDVTTAGLYLVVENAQDYAKCVENDSTLKFNIKMDGNNNAILTQDNFKSIGDATEVKGWYSTGSASSTNRTCYAQVTQGALYSNSANNVAMYDFYGTVGGIRDNAKAMITACSFSGTSVDDMTLSYTIKGTTSNRMPQYRVELVKNTEVDGKTVSKVIQAQSVGLTTTAGTYSMNKFPADMFEGNPTFTLRIWIEKSGKGEVVYYHEIDGSDTHHRDSDGNYLGTDKGVVEYADNTELGDYAGRKYYVPVMNGGTALTTVNSGSAAYCEYPVSAGTLLPNPVIRDGIKTETMEKLTPVISSDGSMYYNIDWDVDENNNPKYANASYKAEFTGIRTVTQNDDTVSEVTDTLGTYTVNSATAVSVVNENGETESRYNIVQLDTNGWNYDKIKVRVVRVGSNNSIGTASEKTYDIYRRLQTLNAPTVRLDTDSSSGLNYNISWSARNSADVCAGYKVFMTYVDKDSDGNDVESKPIELTELIPSVENQTAYKCTVDLEAYSGKTAQVYVVAYPYMNGELPRDMYEQSENGTTTIVNIAERADKPEVNFTAGWAPINEDGSDAVTEDEFNEGAVEIKAAIKAIGNDELYNANLQGVVFESFEAATAWIDRLNAAENDTERIQLVQQLMALNNIEGTDNTAGELTFGILNMSNDTASSKNDSTRDWLYYTQSLTKSNDGIGYQNAGHYVIPLVRRITNASAAAYSVWSWDARDGYAGILQLPRIKLNAPEPTVVSETMSPNGTAIGYKEVDENNEPVNPIELTNVTLPLRKHTWEPSATIKADAYDLSVLSDSLDQLNYRLEYSDGQVVIQPYTITTDDDGKEVTTYSTAMPVSKAFADEQSAKDVFGSTAVLTKDTSGTLDENNVRHYKDVITIVPQSDDATTAEPVEVIRREYEDDITADTEFTYTYTEIGAQVSMEGNYVYASETYRYRITQSPQIELKANAEGITQYSVIHAGVDYTADSTPITFYVPGDAETEVSVRNAIFRNYREINLKAVIKDPKDPQYVSSDVKVSTIW